MSEKIEPRLHVTYSVIAYDDVGATGWGENCSKDFDSSEEAIAYARSLEDYLKPQVFKKITMTPINQLIYDFRRK